MAAAVQDQCPVLPRPSPWPPASIPRAAEAHRRQPPVSPGPGVSDAFVSWRQPIDGPVGGRLRHFLGSWAQVTTDRWVLELISYGYALEFTSTPPSVASIRQTPIPSDPLKRSSLEGEVASLLIKQAVRVVPRGAPQSAFMSTFFLVAKKEPGTWRPVLNLKPLNKFIRPRRFRMETLKIIMESVGSSTWAASLDLKDAYLHVPINPHHWRFLRFLYDGTLYEFTALPFGLSTAPRVFTRLVGVIGAALRRKGILLFMYLDDWLILGRSFDTTVRAIQETLDLAVGLGFIVNVAKSHLTPSQMPTFLGARLDLCAGVARPTDERIANLRQCVALFLSVSEAPARAWLKLLGLMASMVDLVNFCRLRMRPIQLHLLAHFRPSQHSIGHLVPTTPWLIPHLHWWLNIDNMMKGRAFRQPSPSLTMTTDASLSGWGAVLPPYHAAGLWDLEHRAWHINLLELVAVFRALKHFQSTVTGHAVRVRSDNLTVVAYINHQGGTRSARLCALTWELLHWCMEHEVVLSATHLPGVQNGFADALSRGQVVPTEWSLLPEVVQSIFRLIDRPHVDLFATALNNQLPVYCTRSFDPHAWRTDALAFPWDGLLAYAFPPLSLISRVLAKVERENCKILLIAPFWPRQPWFPRLTRMLVHRPVILPRRPDILSQPRSGFVHPAPENLYLTCWVLSRNPSVQRAFRNGLRRSPRAAAERRQERFTTADYTISINGAGSTLTVPPILLWEQ